MSQVSRDVPLSYQPSKWFEREAAIEVIKVTTSPRPCKLQAASPLFRRAECPRLTGFAATFTIWCSKYRLRCPEDTTHCIPPHPPPFPSYPSPLPPPCFNALSSFIDPRHEGNIASRL